MKIIAGSRLFMNPSEGRGVRFFRGQGRRKRAPGSAGRRRARRKRKAKNQTPACVWWGVGELFAASADEVAVIVDLFEQAVRNDVAVPSHEHEDLGEELAVVFAHAVHGQAAVFAVHARDEQARKFVALGGGQPVDERVGHVSARNAVIIGGGVRLLRVGLLRRLRRVRLPVGLVLRVRLGIGRRRLRGRLLRVAVGGRFFLRALPLFVIRIVAVERAVVFDLVEIERLFFFRAFLCGLVADDAVVIVFRRGAVVVTRVKPFIEENKYDKFKQKPKDKKGKSNKPKNYGFFVPQNGLSENLSFYEIINNFLEKYAARFCTPSTIQTYRSLLKNHILPYFKTKRPEEIDDLVIKDFYRYCEEKNLSPRRFKNTMALLKQVLNYANNKGFTNHSFSFQVKRLTPRNEFCLNRIVFNQGVC